MARYIDADKIIFHEIDEIGGEYEPYLGCSKRQIDDIETADVQPVKHGHWVNCKAGFYHSFGECSECGHFTTMKHNYCPNCGAKMVKPQESEDKESAHEEDN